MCFVFSKSASKLQVAQYDTPVYKIIRKDGKSLFQKFQYEGHTTYKLRTALKVFKGNQYRSIDKGFHSYLNYSGALIMRGRSASEYSGEVVEFIIPKGAKYYVSPSENGNVIEVVSTSIRALSLRPVSDYYDAIISIEP